MKFAIISRAPAMFALLMLPAMAQRRLPVELDTAAVPPDAEIGSGTVVESPLGAYRQTGVVHDDRMVWYFNTDAVADFVRVTVTFPDDVPRVCEIFQIADSTAYWPDDSMGAGYVTGFTFPQTSTRLTESFYFWVSSAPQFGLVFKSSAAGAPCAVESLRVEKLDAASGFADAPEEAQQPGRRKMGLFAEDPSLSVTYGDHPIADDAHLSRFTDPLERQITYLHRTMQNLVIYPVVWYTQALYRPSAEFPPGMSTNRVHPSNYDQLMAARYSDEGIDFWPSIRNWSLPSLAPWFRQSNEILNGTADEYVNAVYVDPATLAPTVRTGSAWHQPPELNALHPRVRAALKNLVTEIASRLSGYSSFRGILLWTGIHSSHSLGLIGQSYDDYSVAEFAKENHLDLPQYTGPDRFGRWYLWIRDNYQRQWLEWRLNAQTSFYQELANILTARRSDALLQIMVQYPIPTEGYDFDHGNQVSEVASYLAEAGIDLDALAANPSILVSRWYDSMAYESYLRSSPPDSPTMQRRLAGRGLDFDPSWQAPFLDKTAGAIMQRTYFEDDLSKKPLLGRPPYWKSGSEITTQVTSPMGAGRQALEYLSKSIALYDPIFLAHGGFQKGGTGAEDLLQGYAAAFTSLPSVRFHTLSEDNGTVFREGQAEGALWYYLVNATGVEQTVGITFPSAGSLQTLGLAAWTIDIPGGQTAAVTLSPYGLLAWKLIPPAPDAAPGARKSRPRRF